MSASVDEFFGQIQSDLRQASAVLLEPGVAPAIAASRAANVPGSLAGLLSDIERITRLVPLLPEELLGAASHSELALLPTRVPRRAAPSRAAQDYVADGERLIPQTWYEAIPVLDADSRPLAWVLWLVECLEARAQEQHSRFGAFASQALAARQVDSPFAAQEADTLKRTVAEIDEALHSLQRARQALLRSGGRRLQPSARRPSPLPQGRAWTSLSAIAALVESPGASLQRTLRASLSHPIHLADRGFLYQRWVGLKLLAVLRSKGWHLQGDEIAALFLGGSIRAEQGTAQLTLWFEPRLLTDDMHPSGLKATSGEVTPDIVLVVPGREGQDAFILDPTLISRPEHAATKARYLQRVEFVALGQVAGVPVRRRPLRSWAATPTERPTCDLFSPNGSSGAVPAWPPNFNPGPLEAWLSDVESHAQAWTNKSDSARRAAP